eukprot:SAG31_NODE_2962_length_4846_cov_3.429956_6_plen_123_part_00
MGPNGQSDNGWPGNAPPSAALLIECYQTPRRTLHNRVAADVSCDMCRMVVEDIWSMLLHQSAASYGGSVAVRLDSTDPFWTKKRSVQELVQGMIAAMCDAESTLVRGISFCSDDVLLTVRRS